jgi:SulP family sulfate permease
MKFFNPPEDYRYSDDIIAGITVGVITIPQAMAFALLAGLPPIYGLYGSFIPLLVYAFTGTSNYLNVGPVSVISIFVFESLSHYKEPFTTAFVVAVVNLGLLIGLIQVLCGVFKLGRFVSYLPKSVISGFVQAAAVVIIISQLPAAFGVTLSLKSSYAERLYQLWLSKGDFNLISTGLFIGSLLLLFILAKVRQQFPTAIVLLVMTGIAAFLFDFEALGISLIGEVPQGLPSLILP